MHALQCRLSKLDTGGCAALCVQLSKQFHGCSTVTVVHRCLSFTPPVPCRHNRYCHYGLKWFLAVAGAATCTLALSAHSATIKNNRQYFLLIALIASYQERADATFVRAASRAVVSVIAASIGGSTLIPESMAGTVAAVHASNGLPLGLHTMLFVLLGTISQGV